MTEAKQNDTVRVHYTGKFDDGEVFDSSLEGDPLEFTIGAGEIIPGFEDAVVGMNPGDKKSIAIPPDDAYGEYQEDLAQNVERESIPSDVELVEGMQLRLSAPNGDTMIVTITDIGEEFVTLDANHPLAGETLTFEIELLEIVKAA